MTEKKIEEYLRKRIRDMGGKAFKFVSPGNNGVPDRLVILPDGRIVFVELKAPGGRLTKLQLKKQSELIRLKQHVWTINSLEGVDRLIEEIGHDI